jgi:hypothetical protein
MSDDDSCIGWCSWCGKPIRDTSISAHIMWDCEAYAEYQEKVYQEGLERAERPTV